MSLSSILNIANSGLQVSQETMRYISTNVTNVNSPNYVRKVVHQEALVAGGQLGGVKISSVQRTVDTYLEADRMRTISEYNRLKEFVDVSVELQALFGTPNEDNSLSSRIDQLTAGFSDLSLEPESLVRRYQALQNMDTFGEELERVADRVQFIRSNVEGRVVDQVNQANEILANLDKLNPEISRETALGRDTSALLEQQSALLQDLSEIMDVRTYTKGNNYLVVATSTGQTLLEDQLYQLQYTPTLQASVETTFNPIQIARIDKATGQAVNPQDLEPALTGGTLKGLLDMRDHELPNVAEQIGQLGMKMAEELNRVSNEHTATPAPALLAGRVSGLAPGDQLNFTGEMVVLTTNSSREIQQSIRVNFDTGTIDDGSGVPTTFTPRGAGSIQEFLDAFNTEASGATMTLDPAQGMLQVSADVLGEGVVVSQDSLPRSAATFNYSIATDSAAGRFGTGAADTDFTVNLGGDTTVTVSNMTVNAGDSGSVIVDQLNADAGFRNAGLTATWINNSTGGELVIESVTNETISAISLTNTTNTVTETPSLTTLATNPSVRGGRGSAVEFLDVLDGDIGGAPSVDFSIDVNGTTTSIVGMAATDRASLVDALNGDANFKAAGLTAYYHNERVYVEHDKDAVLSNPSLTGASTSNIWSASVETQSDGSEVTKGKGFSHFFGLNDVVETTTLPFRETGLLPTDNHRLKGSTLEFTLGATAAASDAAISAAGAGGPNNITFTATINGTTITVGPPATNVNNREGLVTAINADATFQAQGMVAKFDGNKLIVESSQTGDVTGVDLDLNGTSAVSTNTKHGGNGGVVVMEVRGPNNELPSLIALNFSGQAYDFKTNYPNSQHKTTTEIDLSGVGNTSMQDIVDSLNNTVSGMGSYAQFEIDADGRLSYQMTGGTYREYDVRVLDDNTQRGSSSASMSDFFGLGRAYTANGATGFDTKIEILQDPNKMSLSGVETYTSSTVASTLGSQDFLAMNPGNTSGVAAMETATRTPISFDSAGGLSGTTVNMSSYASSIIQQTSLNASNAEMLGEQRLSVLEELQRRWETVSAVNIDEELSNMITFQNSYSASARIITTVSQMFDTLLAI